MKRRLLLGAAVVSGRVLRVTVRTGPGIAGAALVALGAGLAYLPAGVVVAGLFFLLADRRIA